MLTFQDIASQWQYHVEEFHRIQSGHPFWMPSSYVFGMMLPAVATTVLACSILFSMISPLLVDRILPEQRNDVQKIIKARQQFTNLCFNLFIGSLGLYYEFYVLPTLPAHYHDNVIDKIPDHAGLYLFSALQLGFQLWALPVGLYVVKEPMEMILHHWAVLLASTMSGFAYCGFRYFSVYFYGLMELSSIPLAIMNSFRDNPTWRKQYPLGYLITRAAFCFSFLYIRIYMWFFIGPRFLMHDFFLFWTVHMGIEKLFLLIQFVLGVCLGLLQLYWGFLILRGFVFFFTPTHNQVKPSKEQHHDDVKTVTNGSISCVTTKSKMT